MIVKDINTIKESIGVNSAFNIEDISPYIKRAERKFLKKVIDDATYTLFDGTTTGSVLEAQKLAQEAVSNFAYYLGLPTLSLQISSGGIFVPENNNTKSASDKQFKELQRSLLSAGYEALDEMLDFMEGNKTNFTDWTGSSYYTQFKELLVYNTATFQKEYNINNSRQTFLAMIPQMQIVEDQFIAGPVQTDLLTALKSNQTVDVRKEAKALLIKSIVAYTIHKVMDNGLFIVDPNGIHLRFDVLPYEKVVTNVNLKINDFILNSKANKLDEGEEYLKMAMAIISDTDNAADFSEYTAPVTVATKTTVIKTQGIVGL